MFSTNIERTIEKMKRSISIILLIAILASLGSAFAVDAGESRAVIGADLTDEQRAAVYATFGKTRGDITELTVSISDEKLYLDGLVDPSVIGTRSISCVYIETLPVGSGLQVDVSNITWCSREMYINALVTAGISDAKLIVTAPIGVSGTAALTGVYKAYEDITGEPLSDEAKLASTQELVITAEIADQVGSYDAVLIVNELKKILSETVNMTDAQVREEIKSIASANGISVSDAVIDQLVKLCRSLEGLDDAALQKRVEEAQTAIQNLAKAQSTMSKVGEAISSFFKSIGNFFTNLFTKS